MDEMKALLGRQILGTFINTDQSLLWFETSHGPLAYRAGGDCCSETWFADITGADWLKGGVVRRVEKLELPDYNVNDGRTRQEEDSAYGQLIETDKGTATIVYRNSSNGCYGGWLSGPLVQIPRPDDLREITEHDWRA